MQTKRTTYRSRWLPYLLIAPQLAVTLIFFIWPALQAVRQSFLREDPFGLSTRFVGLDNYTRLFSSPEYLESFRVTVVFSISVAALSMGLSLLLAVATDRILRGNRFYTTMTIWPYAVAPAVAGVLWWFMFNPSIGILTYVLQSMGVNWNDRLNGTHAMILVIVAASWKQISYNYLFFLAGLQSIPMSLREAAAIDGSGPVKRFFTVVFPLLSPTTFFLLVVNITYTMFETFGTISATTEGGPNRATNILVFKVYQDGFIGLNLGSSAAQSVILMLIVMALTFVQFRWIERRVNY